MATVSCPICCEDVGISKVVGCPQCDTEVCHTCIVSYVKSSPLGDVTCMSCKHPWDHIFIFRSLPPKIVYGSLRVYREAMLFEREKTLLPETQQLITLIKKREMYKAKCDELEEQLQDDSCDYSSLLEEFKDVIQQYTDAFEEEENMRTLLENGTVDIEVAKVKRPVVLCVCPMDNCRGFVFKDCENSCSHTCGVCFTKICMSCHKIIDGGAEHICKAEDVESVNHILKHCKACPGCGAPSRKTDGCSQVWCLVCHKAWNWNTGEIETGTIHATDYLNFMRREGRDIPRFGRNCNLNFDVSHSSVS